MSHRGQKAPNDMKHINAMAPVLGLAALCLAAQAAHADTTLYDVQYSGGSDGEKPISAQTGAVLLGSAGDTFTTISASQGSPPPPPPRSRRLPEAQAVRRSPSPQLAVASSTTMATTGQTNPRLTAQQTRT
jgi:hypothetical protein